MIKGSRYTNLYVWLLRLLQNTDGSYTAPTRLLLGSYSAPSLCTHGWEISCLVLLTIISTAAHAPCLLSASLAFVVELSLVGVCTHISVAGTIRRRIIGSVPILAATARSFLCRAQHMQQSLLRWLLLMVLLLYLGTVSVAMFIGSIVARTLQVMCSLVT